MGRSSENVNSNFNTALRISADRILSPLRNEQSLRSHRTLWCSTILLGQRLGIHCQGVQNDFSLPLVVLYCYPYHRLYASRRDRYNSVGCSLFPTT